MTLTASEVLIAVVLFSCVPLQYFIVQNWGKPESNRSYILKRITTSVSYIYEKYLSTDSWLNWLFEKLKIPDIQASYGSEFDDGESPAVEVLKFNKNKGYFGTSTEPRTFRSPDIKFRIGQVIKHKNWKYRGVIIGWDEYAKAPPDWLAEMHAKNKEWSTMPNYAILVDTRDRLTPQMTYVPQENIGVIENTNIFHPLIENYFEHFDGTKYIPRPWLQDLYPQDKRF